MCRGAPCSLKSKLVADVRPRSLCRSWLCSTLCSNLMTGVVVRYGTSKNLAMWYNEYHIYCILKKINICFNRNLKSVLLLMLRLLYTNENAIGFIKTYHAVTQMLYIIITRSACNSTSRCKHTSVFILDCNTLKVYILKGRYNTTSVLLSRSRVVIKLQYLCTTINLASFERNSWRYRPHRRCSFTHKFWGSHPSPEIRVSLFYFISSASTLRYCYTNAF